MMRGRDRFYPAMFNPSQDDVRRFFCSVYAKSRVNAPMEAIETLAALWIDEHPHYHTDLEAVSYTHLTLPTSDLV